MRSPTEDYHIDPFKNISAVMMPTPDLNGPAGKQLNTFLTHTLVSKSHKFCAAKCTSLDTAKFNSEEVQCMQGCVSKFSDAYNMLQDDRKTLLGQLSQIQLEGGDKYEARAI
eukprot:CAMPEP_0170482274 /NCGR_PEP_ID=MMETSP0208-20121228/2372_1 /TAXON_ID=197538 /ORGANISM="Strombidium inclinatum, Strain S3" /LENGTH=111 /DNA_ID=CAMNT_0010755101 /DNA_START=6 /DNA_END=341 /DNA_ORIENTATION=-